MLEQCAERVRYCLENAKRWERMASGVHDPALRTAYDFSAGQWRRLAEEIEHAENTHRVFIPPIVRYRKPRAQQDTRQTLSQIQ